MNVDRMNEIAAYRGFHKGTMENFESKSFDSTLLQVFLKNDFVIIFSCHKQAFVPHQNPI